MPAFPLKEQYIKNVAAAREGDEESDNEKAPPPKKKGETKKAPKARKHDEPSSWMYGSHRKEFISKCRGDGLGYQESVSKWDASDEKALFLSSISVSELKRRKFIPAGEMQNPWYNQIHGK